MVANRLVRPLSRLAIVAAAAAALGTAASACNKMPLVAPSGTALTLVSTANVLPVNGSSDIIAILIEGAQGTGPNAGTAGAGTPVHNGTLVTFSTTLGRIEPAEARTEAGRATVKLVADGRSGTAVITAFSGAATNTLEVLIGAAGAARVLVSANPQTLPATGGTVTIQARVEDQQGNGLLGVPVTFSTTSGSLSATAALSGESGLATTTLSTTAAATVTASAGGASGTLSGTVAITLKPRTTVTIAPTGTITASVPATFTVGVGANTIVNDVVVDFGDGGKTSLGSLSATTTVTHFFARSGVFRVTATATDSDGNVVSQSTEVAVSALAATGTANPSTVTLGGSVLLSIAIQPTGASIDRYDWDFGEGAPPVQTKSPQINYIFTSTGTKVVAVRVYPTFGDSFLVFIQVQVN